MCGILAGWQPSREVQEPLPRTIKGVRVRGARAARGEEDGATAALASLPAPRASFRRRPPRWPLVAFPVITRDIPSGSRVDSWSEWRGASRARHRSSASFVLGPCGWAVTGAIFGCSAILHQSRPIQAGPAPLLGGSASTARGPVSWPSAPAVVHCACAPVTMHRTRFGVTLVTCVSNCTNPGLPMVTVTFKMRAEDRRLYKLYLRSNT